MRRYRASRLTPATKLDAPAPGHALMTAMDVNTPIPSCTMSTNHYDWEINHCVHFPRSRSDFCFFSIICYPA